MKKGLLLALCLYVLPVFAQGVNIDSSKQVLLGVDLTQWTYFVSPHKTGLNIGLCGQYKILKQLSLSSALYFNDVSNSRGNGYINMSDYRSRGYCIKLGVQTGVKLYKTARSRHSLVTSLSYGRVNFRESGVLNTRSKYWGDDVKIFSTSAKIADCMEWAFGYEFTGVKRSFKFQYYTMFMAYDSKEIVDNSIAAGYRSVFLPGYGFYKMGLNCIYSFNLASQ